jgi:hypothetical protein
VTGAITQENTDVAWLSIEAFNLLDDDQLATLLIHEMLHMGLAAVPGRGDDIDGANTDRNYQQIADACGTKNPLR